MNTALSTACNFLADRPWAVFALLFAVNASALIANAWLP